MGAEKLCLVSSARLVCRAYHISEIHFTTTDLHENATVLQSTTHLITRQYKKFGHASQTGVHAHSYVTSAQICMPDQISYLSMGLQTANRNFHPVILTLQYHLSLLLLLG